MIKIHPFLKWHLQVLHEGQHQHFISFFFFCFHIWILVYFDVVVFFRKDNEAF